jgi:class 3 adenylate cyclase/tetratricopeptide (TPR) repeat protein
VPAALNDLGIRNVSIDAQQDAISLTVLRQDGGLAASLTDFRLIAKLARSEVTEAVLRNLQRDAQQALAGCADSGADEARRSAAATRLCAFGGRVFNTLLPGPIRSFLRDGPPRTMSLQLDAELAWVPWELAFDGESFLGEKFRICRQIVADEQTPKLHRPTPRRGALKVLVLAGGTPRAASEAAAQSLIARLRIIEGVAVSGANTLDLRRDDLLDLIGTSDIVHYVGPVDTLAGSVSWWHEPEPLDVRSIASLPAPPQLLISQNTVMPGLAAHPRANQALAANACTLGLSILIFESARESNDWLEFMLATYRSLIGGAALGESVRVARSELHRHSGIAGVAGLQAELYGDGGLIVFAKDRHARGEDNLRQVTIMSLDLVESTRLMAMLGAERFSEVLAEFHRRCAEILGGRGGALDDPQGDDGSTCYFGFPVAREDAASQALRAGFELIDAVQTLGLSVRIGVCTGQVVVRDGQPVGSAIHFAARLQSIAAPGTIVVGESTRRIVRERFRFQPLEHVPRLKGFDQPEPLYRALGPAQADASSDADSAVAAPRMTPFVGRGRELQALEEHWAAAQAGTLQVARIVGDAGIGKSRLVRELKRALEGKGHEVFELRCAPEHSNSAFHPIVEWLRKQLRILDRDPVDVVLEKVGHFVAPAGIDGAVPLLADLLSIPMPSRHPVLAHSAERRRQLMLNVLVAISRLRLQRSATCLIAEDIHWMDPSTGEFINRLAVEAKALPLLVVVTARSDVEVNWHPRFAVHETQLRGLSPESSRMLVLGTSSETRLPSEVVHQIAARADGVPLFIEESTRMAVELAAGRTDAKSAVTLAVPTTILDLLTARLDHLGGAKQIAQIGGTIGREFPLALLQAVLEHASSPFTARDLPAQLAALIRSGMLITRSEGDGIRYGFKHALMRDAAYRSLLERDRIQLHRVIANVVSEQFRELAESQPELLAFHFTEAGVDSDALRCWESAARQAASRSAHVEAINHVTSALAVLARLPRDTNRDRVELRLQLLLATRLIATEGYGADRVERVYARAMELANALGDESALMKILLGLEGYHFMRADFTKARDIATDAGGRAKGQSSADAIRRIQSKWAIANIVMHQGEMEIAVRQMDACRAEYDQLEHRPDAVQDPGVMCLCYSAWSLWQLGFPDQALQRVLAVVARAEQLKHKFSIGEAYGFRASVQHFRGESHAALESAERAIEICEECGFVVWLAHARLMRGRVVAELGDTAVGIDEMRQAYELWSATGAVVTTPFYLALRAEGFALGGRPDEGLVLLEDALAIVNRCGERYYEAEIRRLFGQLILQSAASAGLDRSAEAESWLREAQHCAQSRKLKSLALRCAITLADLWHSQRRHQDAIEVLEPAYQAIHEGAGTRDLVKARDLLAAIKREIAPLQTPRFEVPV